MLSAAARTRRDMLRSAIAGTGVALSLLVAPLPSAAQATSRTAALAAEPRQAVVNGYAGAAACGSCHAARVRGLVAFASSPGDAGRRCEVRPGGFPQREVCLRGHDVGLLDARWQVLRPHRRAGRQARGFRDQVHVRRRAAAAVSDRTSRRKTAGARNRVGFASEGARRPAMVSPLSGSGSARRRSAALDRHQPELEFHVRRVPLDAAREELRCRDRPASTRHGRRSTSPAKPATVRAPITWRGRRGSAYSAADNGFALALDERRGVTWAPVAATGNAQRSAPRTSSREIDMCARCHARAARISDDGVHGKPPHDTHRLAMLDEGLYWTDGQIRDEVYEWGSFVQSRMSAAGVTCSDCHEPHTQALRRPGNEVCAQCHQPAKYDAASHTHHPPGTPGAACVSCHMPTTTYMQIDVRHDHSLRDPAARSLGEARHAERMQCMSCEKDAAVGGRRHSRLDWSCANRLPDLRRGVAGGDGGAPAPVAP